MILPSFQINYFLNIFADFIAETLRTQNWIIIHLSIVFVIAGYLWMYFYFSDDSKPKKITGVIAVIHGLLLMIAAILRLTA